MEKNQNFAAELKGIKMVITDVDGVLTDGGLYYTEDGLVMKKYNVKDGMGALLLRKEGILCGIISTDTSPIIKIRGERLKMDFVETGIWDKKGKALELCEKYGLKMENVAFIGDDVNDTDLMNAAGLSACPADSVPQILQSARYICSRKGGEGAFREFVDLILGKEIITPSEFKDRQL